ncbi:MAG: Multidrug resistance protein MdtL [Holosporales bacterium]
MILFVSLILELLAGMEVDLFIPSLPLIQECFKITPFLAELTFALNLIGYCFASFTASPIANKLGKKNAILLGCLIFIIGSLLCSFALTFSIILCGRFLQGVGIALPCVLAYVIVTDYYAEDEQVRFMGYMNATITFGMAIAPIIGAFVASKFGWCGNFHALSIFGILTIFFVLLFLPSDTPLKKQESSFKTYKTLLKEPINWQMMISIVIIFQGYWVFIALSPLLYIEVFKIKLIHFGYYQGSVCFVFALISIVGGKIIRYIGEDRSMKISLQTTFFSGFLVILCLLTEARPFWITASLCIHSIGTALPIMILWPMFMNLTQDDRIEKSALVTALRLIVTAFSVQFVSYLYDQSFYYIGVFVALFSFITYPLLFISYKNGKALKKLVE